MPTDFEGISADRSFYVDTISPTVDTDVVEKRRLTIIGTKLAEQSMPCPGALGERQEKYQLLQARNINTQNDNVGKKCTLKNTTHFQGSVRQ